MASYVSSILNNQNAEQQRWKSHAFAALKVAFFLGGGEFAYVKTTNLPQIVLELIVIHKLALELVVDASDKVLLWKWFDVEFRVHDCVCVRESVVDICV
jgi:hypothetical protein